MAERLTVSQIRAMYEAIAEENKTLPNFDEVDFETKWQMIELLNREILGIDTEQGPGDGKTIDEKIEELEALIETLRVYDQAGHYVGKPSAGLKIFSVIAVRPFTLPEDCTGSQAKVGQTATSEAVFSIRKNGFEIGTITFAPGVTSGVFSAVETSFVAGDILTLIAPDPQDDTLEDICWNFKINLSL